MGLVRNSDVRGSGFSIPRIYNHNRFVYVVLAARAGGMAIGVDLNPKRKPKVPPIYRDIDQGRRPVESRLEVEEMAGELTLMLNAFRGGRVRDIPEYRSLPDQLLQLRQITLSGEAEPTLAAEFPEALLAVIHVRALSDPPFVKIVVNTNGTGLNLPGVPQSLRYLKRADEVWIELNGGTQTYFSRVNQTNFSLERILSNILVLGRERPVVIQSLFPTIDGEGPAVEEIEQYGQRLLELKDAGARFSLVQIYSIERPIINPHFGYLPLKDLSRIAQRVHQITGLQTNVS